MTASRARASRARFTHAALLLFGFGLILGFVAVVFELDPLQRPAAAAMAVGIAALPLGMAVDWRRATRPPPSRRRKPRPRRVQRAEAGAGAAPRNRIARGTSAGEVRWRRKE